MVTGTSGGGNVLRLISLWEQRRSSDEPLKAGARVFSFDRMSSFSEHTTQAELEMNWGEAALVDNESLPRSLDDLVQLEHQACNVQVAWSTKQCWGGRHENEDRFVAVSDSTVGGMPFHIVGVMDGHDTAVASDTVSQLLPEVLSTHLKAGMPVADAFTVAMAKLEETLRDVHSTAGTCVLTCAVAGRFVWCSNLGDCRAALVRLRAPEQSGRAPSLESLCWLSCDHKASTATETLRIQQAGGTVHDGRVFGLEPSRTLGDFDVKEQTGEGVISIVPEIRRAELGDGNDAAHALLICATDGVWDVLNGQDIAKMVNGREELGPLLQQQVSPRSGTVTCNRENGGEHCPLQDQQALLHPADDASRCDASEDGKRHPSQCQQQPPEHLAADGGEHSDKNGQPRLQDQQQLVDDGQKCSKDEAGQQRSPHDRQQPLQQLADDLVKLSKARGSKDDCTAIVMLISVEP